MKIPYKRINHEQRIIIEQLRKRNFSNGAIKIPLLLVAVFFMGDGHGTYLPAMGLFPFGLLSTVFFDRITMAFVMLGIIQYPIYGFIIDKARITNNSKVVLAIVILVHIILAFLVIRLTGEKWG